MTPNPTPSPTPEPTDSCDPQPTDAVTTTDWPIRQMSLKGEPKPTTSIERTCKTCHASFIGSAPGHTHERGIWIDWAWYCSVQCAPQSWRDAWIEGILHERS